jgi:hypothetical protein
MAQKNRVTLQVEGFVDREVFAVTYSFNQSTGKDNDPTGIPRGGKIVVKVKAEDSGNVELLHWMTSKNMAKKGSLLFMTSKDIDKKMKSIEFEDAYCVDFVEHWEDVPEGRRDVPVSHWEEITIACRKIVNGPVTYQNEWP